MTEKELQLIISIHNLIKGKLSWGESWNILEEVVESREWIYYIEVEWMLMNYM